MDILPKVRLPLEQDALSQGLCPGQKTASMAATPATIMDVAGVLFSKKRAVGSKGGAVTSQKEI